MHLIRTVVGPMTIALATLFLCHSVSVCAETTVTNDEKAASQASDSTEQNNTDWWPPMEEDIKYVGGFLVPLIGIMTLYIMAHQAGTSRRQYRLSLYEKRYAVFTAARAFLQSITAEGHTDHIRVDQFAFEVAEGEFLFKGRENFLIRHP